MFALITTLAICKLGIILVPGGWGGGGYYWKKIKKILSCLGTKHQHCENNSVHMHNKEILRLHSTLNLSL